MVAMKLGYVQKSVINNSKRNKCIMQNQYVNTEAQQSTWLQIIQ